MKHKKNCAPAYTKFKIMATKTNKRVHFASIDKINVLHYHDQRTYTRELASQFNYRKNQTSNNAKNKENLLKRYENFKI